MALATLSVDFEARLAKLEEGLSKAGRANEKTAADIEKRWASMESSAKKIGAALAAAFSVHQLVEFTKNTIDGLDALNDLKDATGSSIENLSALEDVGARTGTSFESVSAILVKFNKVLSENKAGSEVSIILKRLGLDAEELKRIDPAEALRQTAVALAGVAEDGYRARAIQELFGKSVREAAPFLKDLAEQGKLNAKVTTEQAQAAEDFNKALDNLSKNSKDAARSLLSDLVPAMAAILKTYNDQGLLKALDDFGERVFGWTTNAKRKEIKIIAAELDELQAKFQSSDNYVEQSKYAQLIDAKTVQLKQLRSDFQKLTETPQVPYSDERFARSALPSIGDTSKPEAHKDTELEKYIKRLEEAQIASLELSKEEEARLELTSGKLGVVNAAQAEYVLSLARSIDLAKQERDEVGPKISADELERRNNLEKEFQAALAKTPTAVLARQRDLQVEIARAYEDGRLGIVGSTEALNNYNELVQAALPELEKLKDDSNEFAKQAAANIQDAFGETLKRTMKGDFDNIGQLWLDLLINMIAQAQAAQLSKALFGDSFGSSGDLGGLFGTFLKGFSGSGSGGFGTGAAFGNQDYGAFLAEGTDYVPYDGFKAVLHKGEKVTPAKYNTANSDASAKFDFSGTVYNIGAGVSPGQVQAAVERGNAMTEARIRRSLRQGTYQ